ncbi:protein translocase subunit SecD [Gynuella sunshinyii]|uniref:Protein translocase subunit SecD n=1 Tax=Gynuella sunshinyii YC6258 TaxID=1445510 RepID=A0A0C5V9Q5_9GAMM|nr:protein translocase subunit SecD [Gynuella sunshinyii]AJQ96090.1 preprotein translocase subunit SecD [Gynuella sunshinyii YC6258]
MNRYPIWKYLVVLVITALGVIYSLPNLYAPDPAIQITPTDTRLNASVEMEEQVLAALDKAGIEHFGEQLTEKNVTVRLKDGDKQLQAKAAVQVALGDNYVVALNKEDNTPKWLTAIGASPMTLGLDLSGGVHFLLQVDMDEFLNKKMFDNEADLKRQLREQKIRFRSVDRIPNEWALRVTFRDQEAMDTGKSFIRTNFGDFTREDMSSDLALKLSLSETKIKELEDYAISQNLTTLKNRVNELGVAEPQVLRQGRERIVVELPGIQDPARAKKLLGKSANLEFRLEAQTNDGGAEVFYFRDQKPGQSSASLESSMIVSGDNVTNARVSYDQQGLPQVNVELDSKGGSRMGQTTKNSVGRRMAVLFIEQKTETSYKLVNGEQQPVYNTVEEKSIISLATIRGVFSNSFVITGLDSPAEATELALLLRAGALAAPMKIINERTIGASLGADNISLGFVSVVVGFVAVMIIMIAVYRAFGLFANIALFVNLLLIIALLSMLGATLTLPGIAGIVLNVGMAVDANVLIFSRIREEMKNGLPPQSAINAGYDRAFVTILDANLTTLIVAVILYAVGTGPVKGFAVTLSIGIVTSMFTAIMLTRALSNLILGGKELKSLPIWEVWKWQK